jgi:hypothetical protein
MDSLHQVLRSLCGEAPPRRDHLDIFREFLSHLDRASRPPRVRQTKAASRGKARTRRNGRR